MKYCARCGAQLNDDAIICNQCGAVADGISSLKSNSNSSSSSSGGTFDFSSLGGSSSKGNGFEGFDFESSSRYNDTSSNYGYNDGSNRYSSGNGCLKWAIRIFLIFTVLGVVASSIIMFNATGLMTTLGEDVYSQLINDPTFVESGLTVEQAQEIIAKATTIAGFVSLIPLLWVLPMTIKACKAMSEGTPLSTVFKICTLLFVNVIAGALMLCSENI